MNPKIQPFIKTVRGLPFPDQLEILQEITRSMSVKFRQSDMRDDFWHPKTAEEHSEIAHTEAVSDVDDLIGDFWPEDESADDFITYTYDRRREDRERH